MKNNKLSTLFNAVSIIAYDVGARRGVFDDLRLISKNTALIGFEPDQEECQKLNSELLTSKHNYKSITYFPYALGKSKEKVDLNIYSQPGCSSKFKVKRELSESFSRSDYFDEKGVFNMDVVALDSLVESNEVPSPDFIKIDVQGMEVEVFQGGAKSIRSSVVGIRTEAYFRELYENQPLFNDIDTILRGVGFVPIRFLEMHEWRRLTKVKHPKLASIDLPYSYGEMMHADILYLLDPENINISGDQDIKKYIKAALVALCYRNYDYAYTIFSNSYISAYVSDKFKINMFELISELSIKHKNEFWLTRITNYLNDRFNLNGKKLKI